MTIRRAISLAVMTLAALTGSVFFGAPTATAATVIDGTQPEPDSVLDAPPTEIILVFDQALETEPAIIVQDANRSPVASEPPGRGDDATIWISKVTGAMGPGVYSVVWRIGADNGRFSFTISPAAVATTLVASPVDPAATAAPTVPGAAPAAEAQTSPETPAAAPAASQVAGGESSSGRWLGTFGRWLSYAGIGAIAGALLLFVFAWPEGVEYLLTVKYLRTMWILGMVGTVMHVASARAAIDGSSFTSGLSPTSWSDLATENGAGLAVVMRFVLLAASLVVVLRPDRVVHDASQIPALAFPLLALFTFGFSRHGIADFGAVGTAAAVVHAVSFAAWFGGIAILARVVLTGPGEADLLNAVRGFGSYAGAALIGAVLSGGVLIVRALGGVDNLVSTGYGRWMLVKCFVVIVAVVFGAQNRAVVRTRLAKAPHLTARTAARLRRAVSSELLTGFAIIALSGWMMSAAPPKAADQVDTAGVDPVRVAVLQDEGGVDVEVGANPAQPGLNAITVTVAKPATGLVEMVIRLTHDDGLADGIEIDVTPKLGGKGSLQVLDVPLGAPGLWTVTVRGRDVDGEFPTVTGSLVVGDVGAPTTAPPATDAAPTTAPPATVASVVAAVTPNNTTTTVAAG